MGRGIQPPSTPQPTSNTKTYTKSIENARFLLDHHDGATDQPTDRRTDKASYRIACPQLKIDRQNKRESQNWGVLSYILPSNLILARLTRYQSTDSLFCLFLRDIFFFCKLYASLVSVLLTQLTLKLVTSLKRASLSKVGRSKASTVSTNASKRLRSI